MYNLPMVSRFRVWLPLSAVLIVLLSIALMLAYGVPSVRSRLAAYAENRTFAQAGAVAAALSGVKGTEREKRLDLSAETASGEIILVDQWGKVVDRAESAGGFEPSKEMLQTAASGGRMVRKSGPFEVAIVPVLGDGKLMGGLVFASEETQSSAYRLFLRSGLEAAGVATIIGGGLMLLLATLLSRRVERLAMGARSIEGGDLSYRISPGFKDELGDLAETFNTMAAKLQDSFAELENRVAERTAELEAERSRLEAVLRQMPSGVVIAEAPSGRLLLGNDQVERIWGRPLRPLASIEEYSLYETFRSDGQPIRAEERPLARSIAAGEVVEEEDMDFVRGDDTIGTMRISSAPIRDRDGRIVAGVAIFSDVTERKRAEHAVRESEERYRAVAETATDAIVMIDEHNLIRFVNGAAERTFGYARAEMLGQTLTMLMPGRLREAHQSSFERYLKTGKRNADWDSFQIPGQRKSGEEVPLEISFGEFGRGGKRFFTGFMRDVTERIRAEESIRRLNDELEERVVERTAQLEQERATLDTILANLSEGVLAASSRDRVVFANPAAWSMLGLGAEVPDRRSARGPAEPFEDFDLWGAVDRCALERGRCIEARVQSRDALLRVKLEHLPELGDRRGGALIVMQDLSEDLRLQARQQRFLINAAHELKTPITTILGASELLLTEEEDDPEVRRRFLGHIFEEARRMHQLSETLLRVARVGSDPRGPDLGIVDLEEMAREVIRRMAPLAESAGIELSIEDASGNQERVHDKRVRADKEWLEEALVMIVGNAVKHSGRGGRVILRLEGGLVAVADEGEGISEDDLPRVFDRFYQGEGSSGGLGLGLSICKELVERMGGRVSIESKEGIGTSVAIELPEVTDD